jgi:hypothetical protein
MQLNIFSRYTCFVRFTPQHQLVTIYPQPSYINYLSIILLFSVSDLHYIGFRSDYTGTQHQTSIIIWIAFLIRNFRLFTLFFFCFIFPVIFSQMILFFKYKGQDHANNSTEQMCFPGNLFIQG